MLSSAAAFHESLKTTPIRDLRLTIAGTPLETILARFEAELAAAGIKRVKPRFYLSTEWGVPYGTTSIAIPFYLARPELTQLHDEHTGFVEGLSEADILRYLRHEMGHVVNYAYQLFQREEWIKLFGSITQPYVEEYRPQPFSRRYVVHLPGWYAQKHPDEDWAETFAVWLTPGRDWRAEYADRPLALRKLEYVDATLRGIADQPPVVENTDLDEDVAELTTSLGDFYRASTSEDERLSIGLDAALRTIFDEGDVTLDSAGKPRTLPASKLIRECRRDLTANVYRWTGHFPERTQKLLRHLAVRADELKQVYPETREGEVRIALATLVTALAMNHVYRGSYLPEHDTGSKEG